MTTVLINEKINLQFVIQRNEVEKTENILNAANIKHTSAFATKENVGRDYPIAEGRPEFVFRCECKDLESAVHIKWLVRQL